MTQTSRPSFRSSSIEHSGLVGYVLRTIWSEKVGNYCDYEDMEQEGFLALLVAKERYDGRGAFSSYAIRCIRGYLLNMVNSFLPAVSLSASPEFEELLENTVIDPAFERKAPPANVEHLLLYLEPRERLILNCHYGIDGSEALTYQEIAPYCGWTSGERVRQVEKRALSKIRQFCEEPAF